MLGLRGVRLGLMIPDFVKIQTRAILNAQVSGQARPVATPIAKIMIPLVGHVNELSRVPRNLLEAEADKIAKRAASDVSVDYKFGTHDRDPARRP